MSIQIWNRGYGTRETQLRQLWCILGKIKLFIHSKMADILKKYAIFHILTSFNIVLECKNNK